MNNMARRPKLLIVEDDSTIQDIYQEVFEVDYDLQIAGNKENALTALRNQVFDVAVVDMRLEDEPENKDGLVVVQFIRELGYAIPVILKSAYPTEVPDIERLGLFATLDKTAEGQIRQLQEVVARAAAQSMAHS